VQNLEARMSASQYPAGPAHDFDIYIDHVTRCVEVVGELDMATAPLLADAATSLRTYPARDIAFDLASVTFIDAAGLGAIVDLANVQRDHGVHLHLTASDRVKWVAGICNLGSLFD
jgi:anti-anti-sigma factor